MEKLNKKELAIVIGKILRKYREEKKLSQEELGFRSNLHRTYIGMIERGEKNITIYTLLILLRGLDVELEEFCKDFLIEFKSTQKL